MQVLISLFGKNTDHGKCNITILPKCNVRIHLFIRETNFMQTIYSIDEVSQQFRHPFVTIPWVGNSYDQAQLRSIRWRTPNTVSSDNHGLCQHGTSFATHIAPGKSHGTDYFFRSWETATAGRILKILGVENFGELFVTVTPGNKSLIVTAGHGWSQLLWFKHNCHILVISNIHFFKTV